MPPTFLLQIVNLLKKGVKWLTVRPDKPDINFNTSDQNIRIDHLMTQNITININKEANFVRSQLYWGEKSVSGFRLLRPWRCVIYRS